ncbi:MAG: putative selenium-dependent hydroxylase accessory protein YqeC, partial [Oscillospiraceae bacterium]|nr:putative selenium-dependent hydroxylase accessory protein YqeC [Oscillospiraceae bacterium]
RSGINSIIGSGGKTTLISTLAEELKGHRRIICTTTRIFPSEGIALYHGNSTDELAGLLDREGCICAGVPAEKGKLAAPSIPLAELAGLADYILVEADGSKHLPAKAHLEYEPVIPEGNTKTIQVFGASAFGRRIDEAAHRYERYAFLAGTAADALIGPETAATVINAEKLCDAVFINQVDSDESAALAIHMAGLLEVPAYIGSLRSKRWSNAEK